MAPLNPFHSETRRAAATSGGRSASATWPASATTTPRIRPITGNHQAARPSAAGPVASGPGTGTTVRKRTARISDRMSGQPRRRARRSDGQDGIAPERELELLGFGVAEALDQLVAKLGAAHDAVDEHLGRQLV